MSHPALPSIPFTQSGLKDLQDREKILVQTRPEILVRLQAAREMGDLSENGAYKAARFELSDLDRELRRLQKLLLQAEVVPLSSGSTAGFGSQVWLEDTLGKSRQFQLVSSYESNPAQGKISIDSPLGQAIVGHHAGDTIKFNSPLGTQTYRLQRVG